MVAQQEKPLPGIHQPQHAAQHARAVRPAIGQIAQLQQEDIFGHRTRGRSLEATRVTMHIAHHPQPGKTTFAKP